jgi:cytosine/uracil/thiamine/allantoin permease
LTREALAELPPDIAGSPLFNGELAPTPQSRRTWTTYNFAALLDCSASLAELRRSPDRAPTPLTGG